MTTDSEKSLPNRDYSYIDDNDSLVSLLRDVRAAGCRRCSIDTEADSLHCYEEKLCLIQFSAEDEFAIIDPLAIDDLSPLVEFLDDVEVWLHGADFDMRMLRRTFDRVPERVLDTQIAARLLGAKRFGLANLVEEHFGVVLPKGSQKADWGKRPLSEKMLDYAVNDVRYLLPMAETLVQRLGDEGRFEWFEESCAAARENAMVRVSKDEDQIWRITGWGKLERKGMAYLRALWRWRDSEAARRDRPSFKIIGNDKLLEYSRELQEGKRVNLPERFPPPPVRRFRDAINAVSKLPKEEWPEGAKRQRTKRDPRAETRFDQLKAHRDEVAEGLGIDGTLIGSRATLEAVAANPSEADEILLGWQLALMDDPLSKIAAEE